MELTNIYLMQDLPTGYYKIGRSYDPAARERTLLAQAPQVELVSYWPNKKPALEKWLHERFVDVRRRGEWFELDEKHLLHLFFIPVLNYPTRIDVRKMDHAFAHKLALKTWRWECLGAFSRRKIDPDMWYDMQRMSAHIIAPDFAAYHALRVPGFMQTA